MEEGELKKTNIMNEAGEKEEIYIPDGETESWLNRNDMNFYKFSLKKSQIEEAKEKYTAFVAAAWEQPQDSQVTAERKKDFLEFVSSPSN